MQITTFLFLLRHLNKNQLLLQLLLITVLINAIGWLVNFCKPVIKPSLGPGPKFAVK